MDWLRILGTLTPSQRAALDLPRAWLRFRSEGGADDADAFRAWLVLRRPDQFATAPTTVGADPPLRREGIDAPALHASAPAANALTPAADDATRTIGRTTAVDDVERTITLAPQPADAPVPVVHRPPPASLAPFADRPELTLASTRTDPALQTITLRAADPSPEGGIVPPAGDDPTADPTALHHVAERTRVLRHADDTVATIDDATAQQTVAMRAMDVARSDRPAPAAVHGDTGRTLAQHENTDPTATITGAAKARQTSTSDSAARAQQTIAIDPDPRPQEKIAMDGGARAELTLAIGGAATAEDTIALAAAAPPARSGGVPDSAAIDPVEVSLVLPARFALRDAARAGDANRTIPDCEAPTLRSPRRDDDANGAGTPLANDAVVERFHYEIVGTAGEGGMGTVLIAKDTELLRRVALKQLSTRADGLAGARTRFLREAQITAQLDHPNIVPVHTLEVAPGGAPAYTMKLVEGRDFHALLDAARAAFDGGRPDETIALAARIEHFLKVCDAIAYAHDKGVIHRDLKPANLMLGRHNEVYVMDWGLCRMLHAGDDVPLDASQVASSADVSGGASDTQMGDIVGTPKYMSPEQAQGRNHELDTRSDQCALGLILYELATLNPPYLGKTAYEVLANAAAGRRRPLVHAFLGKRGVPRDLGAIIDRATARMPAQRYASVAELAADVRRYLRGDPVIAHRDTLWQRTQRAIGRHRQRVLTGILALIALSAITIGALLWRNQQVVAAEHVREQRLLQLRDAVASVSSDVQVRMVQLESAIENLSDSVAQITDFGEPVATRFYTQADFRDPARAPSDLTESKAFGGRISLSAPVWTLPSGADEAALLPTIRKLAALQTFHRDIYHRAAVMIRNQLIDIYAQAAESGGDDTAGNPLEAIALGLSSGVSARYPGWDGLPEGYDPRQQRWYQVAEGRHSPQWSEPYRSATTHRTELSISVPMYANDQRFLGVAGALLDPDLMVKSLLEMKGIAAIRDVVLIDATGHILASLNHTLNPLADGEPVVAVFPVPELLTRQKLHETGILETTLRGAPVVLAFDEVEPLGWYVVAEADPDALAGPR